MFTHVWTDDRRCTAARIAIDRLEREMGRRQGAVDFTHIARLCRMVEADVGRGSGVGEKLGVLLQQARVLERAAFLQPGDIRRAKLIFVITCASIRSIVDRMSTH